MADASTFAKLAAKAVAPAPAPEPEKAPKAEPRPGTVVLRLDRPFSTNAMYRSFSRGGKGGVTTIKSKDYRDWQEHALKLIALQKWTPIEGAFGLQIKLPKNTRIDADNVSKSALDTLRHAGVIQDDSPKYLRRLEVVFGWSHDMILTLKPLLESVDDSDRERP